MFTLLSCSCSRLSDQVGHLDHLDQTQSSLQLQDQNHYSLMVIAPIVPTCHWACSTPNRAEGSPRRSNNSDGKVRLTICQTCNFCFQIFCQVRFLIIFFARYDFHLSQAVTASLPQFVLQFSAYMLVDKHSCSFSMTSNGLDLRCCTCWRLSRTPRRWRVWLKRRATSSRGLTSLSSLSSPWYYFEDNYNHKAKCHHHSSLFSPASPLPHSGSLASAAASLW